MNPRRIRFISPLVLLAAAVVAGCGSSSSSSSKTTTAAATTSAPAASSSTATASSSSSAPSATAVVLTTKHDRKLGTILAGGNKKMTVYLFEADRGPASHCSGPCAAAWPPVTGTATASGGAKSSDIGTIKRADGSTQVTYKGHPLYFFVKDKDDGDAYGQNVHAFGADWYVLAPSGNKVDKS
jgi:predicted lipoprotein with Yx(FWY)xxD motif